MDNSKHQSWLSLTVTFVIMAALALSGCSKDSPVSSETVAPQINSDAVMQTSMGPVSMLQVDPSKVPAGTALRAMQLFSTSAGEDSSLFYAEQFVSAGQPATIKVNNPHNGDSWIQFKAGDLPRDLTVIFDYAQDRQYQLDLRMAELASAVAFNQPVKVHLALKNADWLGINIANVSLYVFDPDGETWNKLASAVSSNYLEAFITSTGLYQIAEEEADGTLHEMTELDANAFYGRKFMKARKGGAIRLGNGKTGRSKIKFNKGDLKDDTLIEFKWAADGTVSGMFSKMDFGPHGTYFNHPVRVELSYKMADLSNINEEQLRIWYFNEDTGLWEYIGGRVNTRTKKVIAWLEHFSRYALGPTP